MCPVELIGSHSVTPSTIPKITAFIISKKAPMFPPYIKIRIAKDKKPNLSDFILLTLVSYK